MRKALLITTGLAWLALTTASNAVVVTVGPTGPANPTYFDGILPGTSNFTVGTDVWTKLSGSAAVQVGSLAGIYAAPLGMTNPYMAVEGGGKEEVTFGSEQTSIKIYWGSIDANHVGTPSQGNLNTFAVTIDGYTLTGANLVGMDGVLGNGLQGSPLDNQWVTISGLAPFKTATFSSTGDAFEFSLAGTTVPEPSTWAMMMLGFAGLGYAAFRRNSKGQTAVSAI
jgi:hypothetical protein